MKYCFIRSYFIYGFFLLYNINLSGQESVSTSPNEYAQICLIKADSLTAIGNTNEAMVFIDLAKAAYQQVDDQEGVVNCFIKSANSSDSKSSPRLKWQLIDQAIFEAKQNLAYGHKYTIEAIRTKGEYFIGESQFDSAEIVLSEAILIGEKAKEWEELTWAIITMATLNYYQTDYSKMEFHIDQALKIADSRIEEPNTHLAYLIQLQSILYESTGDYEMAFNASQKTLQWYIKNGTANQLDSIGLANAYNTHGAIYDDRGDYDRAIQHYKIALDLHKKIGSYSGTLIGISNNIGISYYRKTNWTQAQFYWNYSKSILEEKPDQNNFENWINTHQLLALNLIKQKKFNQAILILDELLPLAKSYESNENWINESLGKALLGLGSPEKARAYFKIAISSWNGSLGQKHPIIAKLNRFTGMTYLEQDSLHTALNYFQKSMIALSPEFNDSLGFSNPELGSVVALTEFLPVLEAKGHALMLLAKKDSKWLENALNTYRLAIIVIDKMRKNYETNEAKLLLSTSAKKIYEKGIQLLYQLYSINKDSALVAEAFNCAEKSKSLLLLEMIRSSEARHNIITPVSAGDTLFHRLLDTGKKIKTELLFFERKLSEAKSDNLPANHNRIKNAETALAKLYQENLNWKTKIRKLYPSYYDLQYEQRLVNIKTIKENLISDNSAFLEYFIGAQTAYLFIITDQDVQFLEISEYSMLESVINKFRKLLGSHTDMNRDARQTLTNYNAAAYQLYEIILKAAHITLPTVITKLIIVPDGNLNAIPFAALNSEIINSSEIDFAKLPFLLFQYQIHYGYSANLLLANKERHERITPNTKCLALAPSYVNSKDEQKNNLKALRYSDVPLDGTRHEIREIANFFPGHFDYSLSATESFFKQEAESYGILHLAMHGAADYENPDFAHLKFANLQYDTLEDNLLHYYEITDMKLQAQLVSLSACETGLGKYKEGEGVFSLARSFMYAGAPSVVMSLWKINDQSTSQLMPLFYKHLANGMTKDKALQKAKTEFITTVDLEFRHPFFWSGMVLLGDEQPLKKTSNKIWWWLGSLVVFILLFGRRFMRGN